jgi:CheY-like chemotaxis protein
VTSRPRALVLEDARSERDELSELLTRLGLEVWATESPVKARTWLRQPGDFDLALIDWDMRHSRDPEPTSKLVLEQLATRARQTVTLVHAGNLSSVRLHDEIQRAHPGALLHDKTHGGQSLTDRMRKLMTKRVGDLCLDGDRPFVRHVPTNAVFRNRVGFKFVTQHPDPVFIPVAQRGLVNGMLRFRKWLTECDSTVEIVHRGWGSAQFILSVRSPE